MKKILVVAIALIAFVPIFAQESLFIQKKGSTMDDLKNFYGLITLTDSSISVQELGINKIYKITRKSPWNGSELYRVVDPTNTDVIVEFYINKKEKTVEYVTGIERMGGTKIYSQTIYKYQTNQNAQETKTKNTSSFGGDIGYSTFLGGISFSSVSYGGYIDFGYFGLEYHTSASLNTDGNQMNSYINGQSNKYVGGGGTMNLGFFSKFKPKSDGSVYMGLGVQSYTEIAAENKPSQWYNPITKRYETIMSPTVTEDKKIYPYLTVGLLQKLNSTFTFKGGIILSECSMINVGVGYNF